MSDPHRIRDLAQLREVIPGPQAATARKVMGEVEPEARDFIAAAPLLFVATADAAGRMDVSPKGDRPGFVDVADDRTLLIPERSGNRLTYGFQNLLETGTIGLIFVVPGVDETLRVNGRAELTRDPALLTRLAAGGKPALLVTRVAVQECFFHCSKAFVRSAAWRPPVGAPEAARDAAVRNWSRLFAMQRQQVEAALTHDIRHNL